MQPQHVPPGSRVAELLEQIRIEFENSNGRAAGEYEQQREHMSMSTSPYVTTRLMLPALCHR